MRAPEPLIVPWQGRQVRVRPAGPRLGPCPPGGAVVRFTVDLASDMEELRLILASTLGEPYDVRVSDDGSTDGLRRC